MTGDRGPTRVYVHLPAGLDPAEWRRRHERDEVPDASPYGLDRMRRYGVAVRLRDPLGRPAVKRVAGSVRHRTGGLEIVEAVADLRHGRGADAVLCYDERTGIPAALLSRAPVVTGVGWLTTVEETRSVQARLARRALPRAALVWAQSGPQIPLLTREWGVPASRTRFVPVGIDTDFYRLQPTPERPGVVASAGEDRYRDHELLIRAIHQVRRARPDTTLELATGLPVDFAPDLGTLHTGRLDGRMRDLYAHSSLVAVALRPTVTGSGLSVVLEAMASGRPVVVTANPGIEDYVEHGRTGLLVPAGDCDALAGAIESLLADPERAAEMGRAAAVTVRERFSSEHMAEVLAGLLSSV